MRNTAPGSGPAPNGIFPTTKWSVILNAQNADEEALASFCGTYWFPLYCFARRSGCSPADAEDLTQAFFERLFSRDMLQGARKERGRLRSFLLGSFKNFQRDEWRRHRTQRRGGLGVTFAMEMLSAEERFQLERSDETHPDLEFERSWARQVLRRALERLRETYVRSDQGGLFDALQDQLLDGSSDRAYSEIGAELGLSEAATRFAAFKLRQRYRAALNEVVAETVPSDADVKVELAHLRAAFR